MIIRLIQGLRWRAERLIAGSIKSFLVQQRHHYLPGGSAPFDREVSEIIKRQSVDLVNLVSGDLLDPLSDPRIHSANSYSECLAHALIIFPILKTNEAICLKLWQLGDRCGTSPMAAMFWLEHPILDWILPLPALAPFYGILWKWMGPLRCVKADQILLSRLNTVETLYRRAPISFSARPYGVNLIGPAFNVFGVGEDVRMAARALMSADVPFCVIDFPVYNGSLSNDRSLETYTVDKSEEGPYAFNLVCMPADNHCPWVCSEGLDQQRGRYTITAWPWETDRWPKQWYPIVTLVDEFWPFSTLVADALRPFSCEEGLGSGVPLHGMPPVTEIEDPDQLCKAEVRTASRKHFSLPCHELLFVFAFDLNSSMVRKNPMAVIEAFHEAFPIGAQGHPAVGLVVKTFPQRRPHLEWEALKLTAGNDRRIHIVEADLDRSGILSLYGCCDVFVSLHRSEGLGRGLTEALQLGLDVVATDYGGNTDFCHGPLAHPVPYRLVPIREGDYPYPEGQVWAEPDVHEAAVILRRVAAERSLRPDTPSEITEAYRHQFSAATVGSAYRKRLEEIWSRRFALDAELEHRHAGW